MSVVFAFDHPHGCTPRELVNLLGGKGANLAEMTSVLGLPVPPGFTMSTALWRANANMAWPDSFDLSIADQMRRLEELTGRCFGDPENPLVVAVRSGSEVSMPGMLATVLNVGQGAAAVNPEGAWKQLRRAVETVRQSWDSPRARAYRRRQGIAEDLGTAVSVQCMVFGNRDDSSGTGVAFSRHPVTGNAGAAGDYLIGAQGDEVVGGGSTPLPLSALKDHAPACFGELLVILRRLEEHYENVVEVEFTVECATLWILQCRVVDHPILSRGCAPKGESGGLVRATVGLPASPGLATGQVYFSPQDALDAADRGCAVILVRQETSPEDVAALSVAKGILTCRGGLASHAAVVARSWGIPAVVGADGIQLGPGWFSLGGVYVYQGDVVTIDGSTGELILGTIAAPLAARTRQDEGQ